MKEFLVLAGAGILTLIADILDLRKLVFPIALLGLATAISVSVYDWNHVENVFGMAMMNNYALAFNIVLCAISLLWLVMSEAFFAENEKSVTDKYGLVFFSLVGALSMVSYTHMSMLFIGIEILSISMYVLAGSDKANISSNESAFKYFLMGAFASGFLLFGITLIYGVTGSFDLVTIAERIKLAPTQSMLTIGVIFLLVGMGFKVGAAPFHFWAPDVYSGAPTPITAFMATIVKTAAFAAFYRLFTEIFPDLRSVWADLICMMIVLTLLIGNVAAVMQTNVKRILAYSSISHAGYMLLTLLATDRFTTTGALLLYTTVYSVATILAFTVLMVVEKTKGNLELRAFNGLGKTQPILAAAMAFAMLSMAGIPPLAGFMAKYSVFAAAIKDGYVGVVIFAISMSLVSVYYYLKIITAMFFEMPDDSEVVAKANGLQQLIVVLTCSLLLLFGLLPSLITNLF
jgi:NADH-quinone oxidoreductase subunit N